MDKHKYNPEYYRKNTESFRIAQRKWNAKFKRNNNNICHSTQQYRNKIEDLKIEKDMLGQCNRYSCKNPREAGYKSCAKHILISRFNAKGMAKSFSIAIKAFRIQSGRCIKCKRDISTYPGNSYIPTKDSYYDKLYWFCKECGCDDNGSH